MYYHYISKTKFQLMLHFHCLRSSLWLAHIFRHSASSRKMICLIINKDKRAKQKQLQRNHCKEAISKWRRLFLSSNLPYSYLVRILRFSFSLFLKYPSNRYYNNCSFVDLWGKYCPRSSHQPCKLGWYLDHGHYSRNRQKVNILY